MIDIDSFSARMNTGEMFDWINFSSVPKVNGIVPSPAEKIPSINRMMFDTINRGHVAVHFRWVRAGHKGAFFIKSCWVVEVQLAAFATCNDHILRRCDTNLVDRRTFFNRAQTLLIRNIPHLILLSFIYKVSMSFLDLNSNLKPHLNIASSVTRDYSFITQPTDGHSRVIFLSNFYVNKRIKVISRWVINFDNAFF